jgi:hypothetical protein
VLRVRLFFVSMRSAICVGAHVSAELDPPGNRPFLTNNTRAWLIR